ncbi:vWA domain-containing protein [Treponema sp.]|uniref:vWA domain-containing protein n=1 Tax=Treponema sp. TaxID=166 RepID=UPI003F0FD571
MKKRILFSILIFAGAAFSQQVRGIVELPQMQILAEDISAKERFSASGEREGIDLFIRKKDSINSVMLVETTKDPNGKEPNYAYRAGEWNSTNGDEIRYLDGKELRSEYAKYSLISSTVEDHPQLGKAFHIFIPNKLYYGYPWSRNGSVQIGKGVFINIRTFEKPYGDYSGKYMDNPFMFDIGKAPEKPKKPEIIEELPEPLPAPEQEILIDDYSPEAAQKFSELSRDGGGLMYYSKPENLVQDLLASVERISPKTKVDIVLAIDTTGSMKDDMDILREKWFPEFIEQTKKFGDLRTGLLFYRDYNDTYNYKGLPVKFMDFTRELDKIKKQLDSVIIHGNEGGDIPEAVHEALFASIQFYEWRKDAQRKIILLGDAEPHPKPRGPRKLTQEKIMQLANEKKIILDCIIVPDEKTKAAK